MSARAETLEELIRTREAVVGGIRRILIELLDVRRDPDELDPDAALFGTGLGLDSIDGVELVVAVENVFGVRLGNDAMARAGMRTINNLVDLILAPEADHVTA
jgi:acyl carrier protein